MKKLLLAIFIVLPFLAFADVESYLDKLDGAGKTNLLNSLEGSTNMAVRFEVAQYYYKTHNSAKAIHLFAGSILDGNLNAKELLNYLDNDSTVAQNDKSVELLLTAKMLVQTGFTNNQATLAQDFLTAITVGGQPFSWEAAKAQLSRIPGVDEKPAKTEETVAVEKAPPVSGITGASSKSLIPRDEDGFAFPSQTNALKHTPDKREALHDNLRFGGIAAAVLLLAVGLIVCLFKLLKPSRIKG